MHDENGPLGLSAWWFDLLPISEPGNPRSHVTDARAEPYASWIMRDPSLTSSEMSGEGSDIS
jgi:hypothetical protein